MPTRQWPLLAIGPARAKPAAEPEAAIMNSHDGMRSPRSLFACGISHRSV